MVLHFRNLLLAISVGKDSEALDYSKEYIERLYEQGQRVSYDYILELISSFSELCNRMKYSNSARILLEVACIKACTPVTEAGNGALEKRLENLERLMANGVPTVAVAPNPAIAAAPSAAVEKPKSAVSIEKAVPEDVKNVAKHWKDFVKTIKSPLLRATLSESVEAAYLGNDIPVLVCDKPLPLAKCNNELDTIKKELTGYFGKEFELKVMLKDDYQKAHQETYGAEDTTLKFKSAEDEFANKLQGAMVDIIE
jgi:DNA polymerase III gamma/tau subunit